MSLSDFGRDLQAMRLQAKAHGLDPNTYEMRAFLVHVAEVLSQAHAEVRAANKTIHSMMQENSNEQNI